MCWSFQNIGVLANYFLLVLGTLFARNVANKDAYIKEPRFSFLEKNDVEIKYQKGLEQGQSRSLQFCCVEKKDLPDSIRKLQCMYRPKCPTFEEVHTCHVRGKVVLCYIQYVMPNDMFKAYVLQMDSNNMTMNSSVATYVIDDAAKVPRAVTNFTITTQGTNLLLRWTPSKVDDLLNSPDDYSQLVFCQPTERKSAKSVRFTQVDLYSSSLVVHASNISAVTKYRCCVQVVNTLTSSPSELVCQDITSPEQAPSFGPTITCGNETAKCTYNLNGNYRNTTLTFMLPKVKDRNGRIFQSVIEYRNGSLSNSTATRKVLVNGTATTAYLLLHKDHTYMISMKSATKGGLSPRSNTIQLSALENPTNNQFPTAKVVAIVVSTVIFLPIFLVGLNAYLKRAQILAKRGKLPYLDPSTDHGYEDPENLEMVHTYNTLDGGLVGRGCKTSVSSADNPALEEET